ncbi:tRNA (guanosine(46)-N7)-methyltransferase TrmB [Streptomyces sp. NPDC007088]|uniref:tRNA (guanosine(46)-N7)-methyltransferase TrmB n=1 Tax=Streptomyces sp. NPDC007088 TaxID=3364773 RepID=UPI003680E332
MPAASLPGSAESARHAPSTGSAEPTGSAETAGPESGPAVRRSRGQGRMFVEGAGPAADPARSHSERRIRSFQPRRSRVTASQEDALRRLWSRWGLEVDGSGVLDLEALFGPLPVVLEIGFGMGETTARMAAADPGTGILAVDVHTPGQGHLLGLAERAGVENLRVANGDAVILLRDMLAPGALHGVRVYFPDPWPKARHHKRRLIQPAFLDLAAHRMAPGAVLHCATDWEPYAEHMLEVLSAHPAFDNTAPDGGWAPRPAFRPRTRFEGQGLAKGHVVRDLLFRRNDAPVPDPVRAEAG